MFVGSSDELELHFVLDKLSIELFVNDGEKTMTTEIQTPLASMVFNLIVLAKQKLLLRSMTLW